MSTTPRNSKQQQGCPPTVVPKSSSEHDAMLDKRTLSFTITGGIMGGHRRICFQIHAETNSALNNLTIPD